MSVLRLLKKMPLKSFPYRRFATVIKSNEISPPKKTFKVVSLAEDPSLESKIDDIMVKNWPSYFFDSVQPADAPLPFIWANIYSYFPQFQFAVIDEETNEIAATGHACPNFWDKPDEDLPEYGFTWGISNAQKLYRENVTPNCLVATAVNVLPEWKNYGLSIFCAKTMISMATKKGWTTLYVPLRPVSKFKHPKMNIEEYAALKDDRGQFSDYWARLHIDAGAVYFKTAAESDYIEGTVAQWEKWLPGEKFPVSGEYIVSDRKFSMIAPLIIDVEKDIGIYSEPGFWLKYAW